jgi:hypothetical protein
MCFFSMIRTNPYIKINSTYSFLITFSYYYLLGQYSENPLSFSLSYLFLAVLILSRHRLETFLSVLFLQNIISIYFERSFYPIGSIYGLLISLLSPLIFLGSIFESLIPSISWYWFTLLKFLYKYKGPSLEVPIFMLAVIFFFVKQKKLRNTLIIIFISLPTNLFKPNHYIKTSPPIHGHTKVISKGKKVIYHYEDLKKCHSTLHHDHWRTYCYK